MRGGGGSPVAVAKQAHPREAAVYQRLAPALEGAGVRIPHLLGEYDGWLLIEHVAEPLPRERWGADAEVVATLRALHGLDPALLVEVPSPYRPEWNDDVHAHVLSALPGDPATWEAVRRRARRLFAPDTVVSGDTNPLNWRVGSDGRVVLLDWERLGLGTPTLDLAPLLPGLPTLDQAAAVTSAYGGVEATDVLVAKAWTLAELAADARSEQVRALVAHLAAGLDQWLRVLDRLIGEG